MNRDEDYKRAQEAWVANCTGGSIHEIITVCSSVVASHFLWSSFIKTRFGRYDGFLSQFVIYVLPALTCQTVAAEYAALVITTVFSFGYLTSLTAHTEETRQSTTNLHFKSYLTVYRAGTMLLTCIAILAVDFPIFPRRFAKVETFGTSLMDVGVGSVVFSSGIVASRAYLKENQTTPFRSLLRSIRSALSILMLGFTRLILTKGVDYQEHHSEYGLHWNFFFTLGFLPPLVTLVSFLRHILPFSVLGLLIGGGYQYLLFQGLQSWILEAPRIDIISANKEGICSFLGYLSIFLLGLDSGLIVFSKDLEKTWISQSIPFGKANETTRIAVHLTLRAITYWVLFGVWRLLTGYEDGYQVSRRMANLPYILWVVAFNLTLLVALTWVEIQHRASDTPFLLESVNINGLATFLWANVLTGLVNLTMKTLYASTIVSFLVCLLYMTVVSLLPWVLWRQFQIRVKL